MSSEIGNSHIIIIDDDAGVRAIVRRRLVNLGMTVTTAANGQEAIARLSEAEANFDLMLLDYMLPDTNAEEFLTEHWEQVGRPPFIVLTGFGDERLAVKLMKLGAEDYITKDADFIDHMQSAVERTLRHLAGQRRLGQTERQLKESEERLNLAVRSAGIAVWDINMVDGTAVIDDRWRAIVGVELPQNPVPMKRLLELISKDDQEYFNKRWKAFLGSKSKSHNFEAMFRVKNPRDGKRWVECQAIVVSGDGGRQPHRAICTLHDVTDKMMVRDIEEQLRRAQRLDTLGTMAGGIAHDFNNVLASIMGYNELTMRDPGNAVFVLKNANHISRAAQRAREIIKQILLYSRRGEPEIRQVNLVAIVDEAVGFIRAVAPPDIQLITQYDIDTAIIDADSGQISQVITNLLSNAAHAMKAREGSISVHVYDASTVANDCSCTDVIAKQLYVVKVKDDGPGIPENIRHRIFEPFFSTKRKGEGTGLGLATSQGIISSHGGRITLDSEPGEGACFCITLPKCRRNIPLVKEDEQTPLTTPSTLRVLLVDDEISLAEVTTQLLMMHGYGVDAFHDPQQALDFFKEDSSAYDVAICDYSMPRLNGLELISKLHQINPDLPCILVTGNLDDKQHPEFEGASHMVLLHKPYSHEELMAAITDIVPEEVISEKF
ncbi:ATP-binding response regulator [Cerasicoccus frondis]|uniref:ATP-binding response regulator n=1 Tax=Cerasicoccus frondis TaxID=490090 RepID=UPI002852D488|nr:response regulator [Cerasicoccus frondis]